MRHRYLQPLWHSIRYLIGLHALALGVMTLCRLILLWANLPTDRIEYGLLFRALLIGIKFDNLIVCYIQAIPVVVLTIITLCMFHSTNGQLIVARIKRAVAWTEGIIYALVICIETANARYFHFFDNHLNYAVTEWFGFASDTAGMILQDTTNWLFLLIAILVVAGYEYALVRMTHRSIAQQPTLRLSEHTPVRAYVQGGIVCLLLYALVFVGIRGSLQRYPLKVSFAYFCDRPFYNKLGVNPIFNIVKTAENGKNELPDFLSPVSEQEAEEYVSNELHRLLPDTASTPVTLTTRPNVVLILMESMTSANLERQYNGQYLTPYLRALRDSSMYWSNAFSAGIHTNNGIVASQYGYLPNFARTMMDVNANHYTGLPYYLQQAGYHNLAFVTGNPQYDNMNSFWRENHIPVIYSLYDYEQRAVVNNFGVPDDYMFRFGINLLNKQSEPFFATFLTVSNHMPYVVLETFSTRGKNDEERIIAYADDAIRQFMTAAQQTQWGKNTLYILVADHGAPLESPYEMTLPLNTIPVYFTGAGLPPQQIARPASQTDIWATALGLLGIPYDNPTTGIDLQRQQRKYAFFVSNEHLGVSDGVWFWCYGINSHREHLYRIGSKEDVKDIYPDKASDMRRYGICMQRVNIQRIQSSSPL